MSGVVYTNGSTSEFESDGTQPVSNHEHPSQAFDDDFNFDFRGIASESDVDSSRSGIAPAEGTALNEEHRDTGDEAAVPSKREIAIAALSTLANRSTASHASRLPHPTDDSSPIETQEDYYTIEDLVDHRIDPSDPTRVQIRVKWADVEIQTWEDEWCLQEDAARTLYAYWRAEGGRCCALNLGHDAVYHVFRVLASRGKGDKRRLKCQWVGYPAAEQQCSWEPEAVVTNIARGALAAYFDRVYEFR